MSHLWFIYIIVISKPECGLWGNIKTVRKRCCNDDAKKQLQSQDIKQLQEIYIWMLNGFMLISNYWDNDVLIGGKIKFAWTLAIQTEVRLVKKKGKFWRLHLHINLWNGRQSQSYNAAQEGLLCMIGALEEQLTVKTKTLVILYSNPSVLDEEGVLAPLPLPSVCSPQVHVVFDPVGGCVWTSGLIPAL